MDTILILDYGGQTAQLISRRLRDLGFYTRIASGSSNLEELELTDETKGIILSGSPYSVYQKDAPGFDTKILSKGLPILGICYGVQRLTQDLGGQVEQRHTREYGRAKLYFKASHQLFRNVPEGFISWMSHGDSIKSLAPGFQVLAESEHGLPAAVFLDRETPEGTKTAETYGIKAPLIGIQFHPEVSHCEFGNDILKNFASNICGARSEWKLDYYLEEALNISKEKVGSKKTLLLISGGVDSTVLGALLLKALEPDQVHLLYVDTGLMRTKETEEVTKTLESLGASHIHIIHAEEEFLGALAGVQEPEEKRKIIGDLFMHIQDREIQRLQLGEDYVLAQGTLYTDLIESGKGVGKKAAVIKSHHNVRSPRVEALRDAGRILEPLSNLYKDEVRALGNKLGLPDSIVWRHPFPGPGLAVRILGEISKEKCDILRAADSVFIQELKSRNLYRKIWQAFCVLLPVKSVGVAGDAREYGYVLALRAICSSDGMTADVYPFETRDLLEISSLITNKVKQIGRVVYDVSSKPPATIEWE